MGNVYDQVRYPSLPIAHTHPAALGAFMPLFGRAFVPMNRARVLEIGCGTGANLLSMALGAPGAEFVGVDLAELPIQFARDTARTSGLANVNFRVADIATMDSSWGQFDYVVAHGVHSWVPIEVRDALMRLVGTLLSADGLAFISYNAVPGSFTRLALRDILSYVGAEIADPLEKLRRARAYLADQVESWSLDDPDERVMRIEAQRLLKRAPEVLFHDELGEFFSPSLMSEVCAAASAVGLDYLCDAAPMHCAECFFPSEKFALARKHAGGDWVRFEQFMDFQAMRAFRNSLFCRAGGVNRAREASRIEGLWACADLRVLAPEAGSPDRFVYLANGGARLATNDPRLGEFLGKLAAVYPRSLRLEDMPSNSDLADYVLRLFVNQVVRLRTDPFALPFTPGDRPAANPLARHQAASGESVVSTMHHTVVKIEDAEIRNLIPLLNGERTRADLVRHAVAAEGLSRPKAEEWLAAALDALLRAAILTA